MKKTLLKTCAAFILAAHANLFKAQNIFTFAGTGVQGYNGDGSSARNAQLNAAFGVAVDASGNVYIADTENHRVRKVSTAGVITTFAGTGIAGFGGDGGPALNAQLNKPFAVVADAFGNVYISDEYNNRIRKVDTAGIISTFAGGGSNGLGDGGPATSAQLCFPHQMALDTSGNAYIADYCNWRVRVVNTSGVISTFAGTGSPGYSGDGGPATAAQFKSPNGLVADGFGNVYIADSDNNRIRKVNQSGIVSTFAGTGVAGFNGDGNNAVYAQLNFPYFIATDASGNLYFSDNSNNRVRKISIGGSISTIAGTGVWGFNGDGGAAVNAKLFNPYGVAIDASGNIYIADVNNYRIREICATSCLANINSQAAPNGNVLIFPNPASGSFQLKTDAEINNIELIVINSAGEKVLEQKIFQGENTIVTGDFSPGLYNCILLQDKQKVWSNKLSVK